MILALLLAIAEPATAIDAEHAFAADAQRLDQWTAFNKWPADDALKPPADAPLRTGFRSGGGASIDGTSWWSWTVAPDGGRDFSALPWNGHSYEVAVEDTVKGG